jgi:DNA-binding MarR family transcriptional regulator
MTNNLDHRDTIGVGGARNSKDDHMPTDTTSGEDPRQRLAYLLRRINVELDQLGHEFAVQHRLHPTDMRALVAVMDAARGGHTMTPGRLGEELNLTSPSVTALVDRLERQGHLRRVRDQRDRRRVTLEIEPRALTLGAEFFGPLNNELLAAMEAFSDAELQVADRFLEAMTEVIVANRRARRPADAT